MNVYGPNIFFFHGEFMVKKQMQNITLFIKKKTYNAYFGIQIGDQEKSWEK